MHRVYDVTHPARSNPRQFGSDTRSGRTTITRSITFYNGRSNESPCVSCFSFNNGEFCTKRALTDSNQLLTGANSDSQSYAEGILQLVDVSRQSKHLRRTCLN